jgi:hypothetical protein
VLLVIEYIFFSLHTRAERFNNPAKKHVLIVVASSKSYDGTEFAHVQLRRKDVLAARIQGTSGTRFAAPQVGQLNYSK